MTTEQKAQAYDEALERAKMYQGMLMLNLEDAAREYVRTAPHADIGLRPIPFNVNIKDLYNRVDIKRAFKAGAQWQKQQMMKDIIETTVKVDAGGYPYIPATELYDYTEDKLLAKEGDKVKLVIINEE